MRMKQLLTTTFILLTCIFSVQVQAQTNPLDGYIITNDNDTVWGTIDYVSAKRCNGGCLFRKHSESEFKMYHPTEIRGYRLADNGAYYVTKTFPVEDVNTTFFAEYLLKGGVSLYRFSGEVTDYYYLEDEQGTVAVIKDYDVTGLSEQSAREIKESALRPAIRLLSKSQKAGTDLWKWSLSPERLISITREYNETFCQESGDCVQFQNDERQARGEQFSWRVEAGTKFSQMKVDDTISDTRCIPFVGVGVDVVFPRFSHNMTMQMMLNASKWIEKDFWWTTRNALDLRQRIGFTIGLLKSRRVNPYLTGAVFFDELFYEDEVNFGLGATLGVGTSVFLGRHRLDISLAGEYSKILNWNQWDIDGNETSALFRGFNLTVGFVI